MLPVKVNLNWTYIWKKVKWMQDCPWMYLVNGNQIKISIRWVLSVMARDILSIPMTTVASESSFSTGGQIISKYRSSITPQKAEVLVCARNWLYGSEVVEDEEDLDSDVESFVIGQDIAENSSESFAEGFVVSSEGCQNRVMLLWKQTLGFMHIQHLSCIVRFYASLQGWLRKCACGQSASRVELFHSGSS